MNKPESRIENKKSLFVFPSFNSYDIGEIERIREYFQIKSQDFTQEFLERARAGKLVPLPDDIWDKLENTDSHSGNILRGDWDTVASLAEQVGRDWKSLKSKMQAGEPLDAPIIAQRGEIFHKVSGNTRLMVARALGKRPDVLMVDITDLD